MRFDTYGQTAWFALPVAFDSVFPPPVTEAMMELGQSPRSIFQYVMSTREMAPTSDYDCIEDAVYGEIHRTVHEEADDDGDELLMLFYPKVVAAIQSIHAILMNYLPTQLGRGIQLLDVDVINHGGTLKVRLEWAP